MNAAIQKLSMERMLVAFTASLIGGLLVAVSIKALGISFVFSIAAAVVLALVFVLPMARRLPLEWDGMFRRHPVISLLWLLLAVLTIARTAGVALYMADPTQAHASAFWFDDFYIRHNCFSGYWQAALLSGEHVENLYDPSHYTGWAGRFKLDEFLYLPQFLILPKVGIALGADFTQLRAIWFTLESIILSVGMLATCLWIKNAVGRAAALLLPLVWIASPILLTLQLGNFQLAAIALSVMAMILFEKDRPIAGGALLGFAVFKLFPGILGVYLLFAKRWRAAAWTFAFAVLYTLVAYAWMGEQPFHAFVSFHLPRMASGEAWGFLEQEGLGAFVAINDSVPGLVLKLKMLHVSGMTRALEMQVSWIWTFIVVILAAICARRSTGMSRIQLAATWIALLALASFRSPFLPDHAGLFAPLWLWSLVAASCARAPRNYLLMAILWLLIEAVLPVSGMPLPDEISRLLLSTISQFASLFLCLWVVLRKPDKAADSYIGTHQTPSFRNDPLAATHV